jgi:hypothetical protein
MFPFVPFGVQPSIDQGFKYLCGHHTSVFDDESFVASAHNLLLCYY